MKRLKLVSFLWVPQEQSHNMEVIDEQKSQDDHSDGGPAAEKEGASWLWLSDVMIKVFLFCFILFCFFTLCRYFASPAETSLISDNNDSLKDCNR